MNKLKILLFIFEFFIVFNARQSFALAPATLLTPASAQTFISAINKDALLLETACALELNSEINPEIFRIISNVTVDPNLRCQKLLEILYAKMQKEITENNLPKLEALILIAEKLDNAFDIRDSLLATISSIRPKENPTIKQILDSFIIALMDKALPVETTDLLELKAMAEQTKEREKAFKEKQEHINFLGYIKSLTEISDLEMSVMANSIENGWLYGLSKLFGAVKYAETHQDNPVEKEEMGDFNKLKSTVLKILSLIRLDKELTLEDSTKKTIAEIVITNFLNNEDSQDICSIIASVFINQKIFSPKCFDMAIVFYSLEGNKNFKDLNIEYFKFVLSKQVISPEDFFRAIENLYDSKISDFLFYEIVNNPDQKVKKLALKQLLENFKEETKEELDPKIKEALKILGITFIWQMLQEEDPRIKILILNYKKNLNIELYQLMDIIRNFSNILRIERDFIVKRNLIELFIPKEYPEDINPELVTILVSILLNNNEDLETRKLIIDSFLSSIDNLEYPMIKESILRIIRDKTINIHLRTYLVENIKISELIFEVFRFVLENNTDDLDLRIRIASNFASYAEFNINTRERLKIISLKEEIDPVVRNILTRKLKSLKTEKHKKILPRKTFSAIEKEGYEDNEDDFMQRMDSYSPPPAPKINPAARPMVNPEDFPPLNSMSLLSSWKTLISLPQEKTLQFENIVLNNPAFSQAQSDMQNKILRALQILKERSSRTASDSISRVFYEKIAQIPLSFFTSKNMPNLAETDGVSKIFINEECFKDEKVLFFEIFHELVHISKMDKIENNEIATETNNYLYVMTMLCEMFGPAEAESYITALAGTRLFNAYNVQEMREFFESRLGAIPADLQNALSSRDTQLSYPIILRHILDIAQRVHANKDTADGLFKDIVLLDREQGTQDIVSAVKAYMTITVNA